MPLERMLVQPYRVLMTFASPATTEIGDIFDEDRT